MGNINGKFSDQNDIVTTGLVLTSNNNQTAVNATIAETDQLRGSAVIFQPTGLLANPTNDLPNVTTAAQGDVGAALAGIGQGGTPSTQPGGGGNPCFLGSTWVTMFDRSRMFFAEMYEFGEGAIFSVLSFDDKNKPTLGEMTVSRSIRQDYCHVTFSDYSADDVAPDHRYFTGDMYKPIRTLLGECVVTEKNTLVEVRSIDFVTSQGIYVYNGHVKHYQNYCANGRRVHNLKPIPELE